MRRVAGPIFIACVIIACGKNSRDLLVRPLDGGSDAADGDGGAPTDGASPDADPTLGGPCVDDPQCDDAIACTFDLCDKALARCRNIPDDTRCDDGIYCDGRELCVVRHGCVSGPVVTCEDGDPCTIDRCVEASKSCAHAPRDLDGDGDPDDHCVAKHDCDDLDPTVSSLHAEVCANHKDDNCDGRVDETPCATVAGGSCATAIVLVAGTTQSVSTVGANETFPTSCSVTSPPAARDVVGLVTIPAGANKDLDVWVTSASTEVAVAVQSTCGQASTEIACGSGPGATSVRARARNLAPGTYAVVVTTQAEASVDVKTSLLAPTPRPTNETCPTATPISPDTPTTVSIIDPAKSLASACPSTTGELTYALTLAQAADVKIFSSTVQGSGSPIVGLRAPHCTDAADEIRCNTSSILPLFARNLGPGTYVITVAATSAIDASILVKTYPPTSPPADQTCAAPPTAAINATMNVDLSDHEAAIADGCLPGSPAAALDLPLAVASDVMLIGRFPQNESGAVALDGTACVPATQLVCGVGATPVRVDKRNVPPGDYRAVIADHLGAVATMTTLVRPTMPPTNEVGLADNCASVVDMPEAGGFFVGDTSRALPDFDDGCDASSVPPGGAADQIFRLTLTAARRVVLNMDGSSYTTILDVRQGPSCPGQPLDSACYVGFGPQKSFLDMQLPAGVYFVIIDGYNLQKGPWNLDVRVL